MRHSWSISDSPDLPIRAFQKALGKNRPATLEGGKGGGPSAPNPYAVSNAQTGLFQGNAAFNKALNLGNYNGPLGSQQSYIQGYDASGAPIYQTDVRATPWLQNAIEGLGSQVGQGNQSMLDTALSSYGTLGAGLGSLNQQLQSLGSQINPDAAQQMAKQGQDAYYNAAAAYLDPQYAQQQASMESKLAAQGLAPGTQAYTNAVNDFNRNKAFAYNQAQQSAITQGQQMGLNQLAAQRQNIATQAGLLGQIGQNYGQIGGLTGQQLAASQLPYQQLQSLAGLLPRYSGVGTAGANASDIANAFQNQYLGQLGQYNAQQQAQNANMNSLGGLLGQGLNAYRGYNTLNGLFSGNGLAGYGNALSSISPGAAGYLGDLFGSSIGGVYGPSTQAGLDALIGSFSGGTPAAAAGGAAEAGAAGLGGGAGGGAGAGGAGLGLAAATALPFAIAAGGMLGGLLGYSDNGTPYSRANDAWANAITQNPALLQQYGQGDVSKYMQSMFGGSQWTPEQYQRAQDMLSAASGGGSFFGNFFGAPEQGMGG